MTGGTAEARDSWARSGAVWFHLHCGCRSLHCRPLSRHFPLLRPELPLPRDPVSTQHAASRFLLSAHVFTASWNFLMNSHPD